MKAAAPIFYLFLSVLRIIYTHEQKDLQTMKCITNEHAVVYQGKCQMNVLMSMKRRGGMIWSRKETMVLLANII